MQNLNSNKNNSPLIAGGVVVLVGLLILLKQLNILNELSWLFNWKTLLITIGVVSGAKRNFAQPYGWLIPIGIGVLFLIGDFTNIHLARYIIPIVVIGVGVIMILNASTSGKWLKDFERNTTNTDSNNFNTTEDAQIIEETQNNNTDFSNTTNNTNSNYQNTTDSDNALNINSFFSGSKQVIMHKNFKGGTVNAIMGGAEVNLLQADMQSPAVIDVTVIMGGLKLVIPANWEIKNNISTLFGGVEDGRKNIILDSNTPPKIIVLRGTAIMGGIEIKSL